jgi:hypothetical protein
MEPGLDQRINHRSTPLRRPDGVNVQTRIG